MTPIALQRLYHKHTDTISKTFPKLETMITTQSTEMCWEQCFCFFCCCCWRIVGLKAALVSGIQQTDSIIHTHTHTHTHTHIGFPGGSKVRVSASNVGDRGLIPGSGRSQEMVTQSSILAWRIPWTEEPGRLHRVIKSQTRLSYFTSLHIYTYIFFFILFSIIDYYKILSTVHCALQ